MEKQTALFAEGRYAWAGKDCAVRALAAATRCRYETVSMVYTVAGRASVKKGTDRATVHKLCAWLGMKEITSARGARLGEIAGTLQRGSYLIIKRGHALALVDGVVHDWERTSSQGTLVQECWFVPSTAKAQMEKFMELV